MLVIRDSISIEACIFLIIICSITIYMIRKTINGKTRSYPLLQTVRLWGNCSIGALSYCFFFKFKHSIGL